MTFSIAGFCRETGMFGSAISSSSICVASRCPFIAPGRGVVLTQNVTNPVLGQLGVELLNQGLSAEQVLARLKETEKWPEWRQLHVLDSEGRSAVFSGGESLGMHATHQGRDCVAAGNMLANEGVIRAMTEAFESHRGHLGERLLAALDAAVAAGGEMGPVYSAGLKVCGDVSWPIADLRVDWHISPIRELRMVWDAYRPQLDAYVERALDPAGSEAYGVPGDTR